MNRLDKVGASRLRPLDRPDSLGSIRAAVCPTIKYIVALFTELQQILQRYCPYPGCRSQKPEQSMRRDVLRITFLTVRHITATTLHLYTTPDDIVEQGDLEQ